jgi:hypothetical protein
MIEDDQPEERVMLQTLTKKHFIICNDVKLRTGGEADEKETRCGRPIILS